MSNLELRSPTGVTYTLSKKWTRLGRSSDNDICIKDKTISRYHLNIFLDAENQIIVEDAGSQNGFAINGNYYKEPKKLTEGDELQIGTQILILATEGQEIVKNNIVTPEVATPETSDAYNNFDFPQEDIEINPKLKPSKSSKNPINKRYVIYGVVALLLFIVFKPSKKEGRKIASTQTTNKNDFEKSLPADAFKKKNSFKQKSVNEIRSNAKFREAQRDYKNENFSRALLLFQEAKTLNPGNEKAQYYVKQTQEKITKRLNILYQDSIRSLENNQYRRAKIQSLQILTILSEEIPGFSKKITRDALNRSLAKNSTAKAKTLSQEETLLGLPCARTTKEDLCQKALNFILLSRQKLGEEDVLE